MTGELFRFSWPRWFVFQVVRVSAWSEGYDPPVVERGKGHFHLRIGDRQFRLWKALK